MYSQLEDIKQTFWQGLKAFRLKLEMVIDNGFEFL